MLQMILARRWTLGAGTLAFLATAIPALPLSILFFRSDLKSGTLARSVLIVAIDVAIIAWAAAIGRLHRAFSGWSSTSRFIFIYLAWSGVSLLWTHAASRVVAADYWLVFALQVAALWVLLRAADTQHVAESALQGIAWGGLVVVATAVLLTGYSDGRLGSVDYLHPNYIGRMAALTVLAVTHLALRAATLRGRIFWVGCALVTGTVLLLTVSKTSIVSLAVAAVVYVLRLKTSRRLQVGMALGLLVALLAAAPYLERAYEDYDRTDSGRAIDTFSGRKLLWDATWPMIADNPVIGYGFLSFRDYGPQIFYDRTHWSVRADHAHNEYLQAWFQLGIIGLLITIALYISFARDLVRASRAHPGSPLVTLGFALLAMALVRTTVEADPMDIAMELRLMLLMSVWIDVAVRRAVPSVVPQRRATAFEVSLANRY